ncbi:MAG TPA: SprB repeat-containing protein, partial [Sphingobacteriaceae bacterium]
TYQVTLTDFNNCTPIVQTIVITQPTAALAGTAVSTNVSCNGATDGTITISPSGGYGSYEYRINGGTSWQASNTFIGLAPQTYNVQVRDAAQISCVVTINTSLTITEPIAIAGTATPTHVTCFSLADGTITVNASGGYGTYQYSINEGVNWQSSNTFAGLAPQTYTIHIRDALHPACTYIINNITINQPTAAVSGTAISTNVTCFDAGNGSITITATGGYGSYQYSIDGGANWQADNSFTGLAPDSYSVIIRDASQITCMYTIGPVTIIQPTLAVTATATSTNVTCFGQDNGTIIINATGGYGDYEYSKDGGTTWQTENSFTGLAPDSYSVMVRDASQITCTYIIDPLTIVQPTAAISATATSTNVTCFGLGNGSISVTPSGGYGSYEYSIDGGTTWHAENSFTGLLPNSYSIIVRDASQIACIYTIEPLTIIQPPAAVTATATSTDVTCFGLNNGSISAMPSGGMELTNIASMAEPPGRQRIRLQDLRRIPIPLSYAMLHKSHVCILLAL